MCGRFYVEPEDPYFRELAERIAGSPLTGRFPGRIPAGADGRYGGEVAPASVVPVLAPDRSGKKAVFPMMWGFRIPASGDRKPVLMINARSETAARKPLFRDSWSRRRCVIPATAYFEWERRTDPGGRTKAGKKYRIAPARSERTYLAGLYRIEEGLPVFVVLTREPAEDLARIHDRMPVILPEEGLESWLSPDGRPEECLRGALTETVLAEAEGN